MELFSELYGKYYTLIHRILTQAHSDGITLSNIRSLVAQDGFLESPTSLVPPLIAQDKEGYHLLLKREDKYYSILKNTPTSYFTQLETSWLKSLLIDPKMNLFLEPEDLFFLKSKLKDVPPLFDPLSFGTVQQACSHSDFTDEFYIQRFKKLCNALQEHKLVSITYKNKEDQLVKATYALFKIEYQIKYDSFRLLAVSIKNNKLMDLERIDLSCIIEIEIASSAPSYDEIVSFVKSCKAKEPIRFELSNERSGFDRVFMYLSNYERISDFNDENNSCLIELNYYPFDEAEIIRMLISFGPIIKILSPSKIRKSIKEEIDKQYLLFANFFS